jgi:hypothetical protein
MGQVSLEAISKMSFGPISLLAPRFKSSTTNRLPAVLNSAPPRSGTKILFLRWLLLQSEFELPGRTAIVYNDIFLTNLIHDKAVDGFALADDVAVDDRNALGGIL